MDPYCMYNEVVLHFHYLVNLLAGNLLGSRNYWVNTSALVTGGINQCAGHDTPSLHYHQAPMYRS